MPPSAWLFVQGVELYDEMTRRSTSGRSRFSIVDVGLRQCNGEVGLCTGCLLLADIVGLLAAFLLVEWLSARASPRPIAFDLQRGDPDLRVCLFRGGLWSPSSTASTTKTRNERTIRRPMTSSASSTWSRFVPGSSSPSRYVTKVAHPTPAEVAAVLGSCNRVCFNRSRGSSFLLPATHQLRAEHGDRWCWRCRAACRSQVAEAPRVWNQPRRFRRRGAEGATRGP